MSIMPQNKALLDVSLVVGSYVWQCRIVALKHRHTLHTAANEVGIDPVFKHTGSRIFPGFAAGGMRFDT